MRGVVEGLSPKGARTAIMILRKCYLSCGTTDHLREGSIDANRKDLRLSSQCVCALSRREDGYWDTSSRQGRLPSQVINEKDGSLGGRGEGTKSCRKSERVCCGQRNGRVRQCRLAQGRVLGSWGWS